ncbi:probable aspartyl protease At4g16563 [Neltuma alba]|uniref:probable aspartyl protease At4g16563 n=1 Tax=Neltuma alba TaxID=207710 RepID=UPI0010A47337|nr:probable aspartyl protease At4g16563 [Prosopis alba]
MASTHILCFLCLFFVIPFSSSSSSTPNTITISLSPLPTTQPSSDEFENLKVVSSATRNRAHHLKHRNSNSKPPLVKTQAYPRSYGGYSIHLNFGTPPQTFPFVLDTGSSLVWLPCTSRYLCSKCSFPKIDLTKIPKFIPKNSSSSKIVGCQNPKCSWIFGSDVQARCQDCKPNGRNCSQICPAYIIQYGLGSTAGFLLLENLDFPGKIVPDFLVGCSILSTRQPAGIAGFGRGPESLPSQMGLTRFSYCLLPHRFDDSSKSSELILHSASSKAKTNGFSYAPFQSNPSANNSAFRQYYYISLRKVIVGGKQVKIPHKMLQPDSQGNGGCIVDSGSTFTFMEKPVFDLVAQEFGRQMGNYSRARDVEAQSGLTPCYVISSKKSAYFPELTFQFKGGAKMVLPLSNYFSLVGKSGAACLTIVSDNGVGPAVAAGPAIILGNYQQQDFHVEYDLENNRLGFRPQSCSKNA